MKHFAEMLATLFFLFFLAVYSAQYECQSGEHPVWCK